MTDMVAGKNESGFRRKLSEINNLGPADQKEDPSNQPPAEMREESLRNFFRRHGKREESGVAGVQELTEWILSHPVFWTFGSYHFAPRFLTGNVRQLCHGDSI